VIFVLISCPFVPSVTPISVITYELEHYTGVCIRTVYSPRACVLRKCFSLGLVIKYSTLELMKFPTKISDAVWITVVWSESITEKFGYNKCNMFRNPVDAKFWVMHTAVNGSTFFYFIIPEIEFNVSLNLCKKVFFTSSMGLTNPRNHFSKLCFVWELVHAITSSFLGFHSS
jgi:hypothetical protein